MSGYRVLVVEDDPIVSSHLEAIVTKTLGTEVVVSASVAEAKAAISRPVDFALLDVDVQDGTTYAFASILWNAGIPFAFVSASDRKKVPQGLQGAPFVAKPYTEFEIADLLRRSARAG